MTPITDANLVSTISAEKLVVKDIFCDDYLFTIPNYQRPYSWEEEHCTQLLDDLHSFAFRESDFNDLSPYFLGSAVIIKRPNVRNSQIVDGQQRLTTLTIMLSCLRYSISDKSLKEKISTFIYQSGNILTGTSATYRLQARQRDQNFFKFLIQEEEGISLLISNPDKITPKNDAQEQMADNAKALIGAFALKKYSQDDLLRLTQYIIQKCVIVIVASTDEEMAFRIFNVLNDRGKDLTIADILKSEVLEKIDAVEQIDYTRKWEDCETKLGVTYFKDFFSHLRAIFAKKKAEKATIAEIREYVKPSEYPKYFIDSILTPFTDAFDNILEQNYKSAQYADEINQLFKKLYRVAHTDWIPSAIFFIAKNPHSPTKIRNFLIQLEKVTLGMDAMKTGLNERLDRFAKINGKIERDEDLFGAGSEFILSTQDRTYIIATLTMPDIYKKRLVKPVLAKIEEQMNDGSIEINYKNLNIEHILPQNPTEEYWTSRFTADEKLKLTNSLGNLCLLSFRKNTQASNYEFAKKVKVYFQADGTASNLSMVNKLRYESEWSGNHIRKRNIELLNYFLSAIGLENYTEGEQQSENNSSTEVGQI